MSATLERPQHILALERANVIRLGRAEVKRAIRRGETTVSDILAETPQCMESATIQQLLVAQPRWGVVRANKLCARAAIHPSRTIVRLTARQRATICALLERRR